MNEFSPSPLRQNPLVRYWPWLMVLLVILLVGSIRCRLLETPLERDEGEYAYAGQLILQGLPPYKLAYNMKLPGTYYAYAAGMTVFGQTTTGIHLMLLVVNAVTIATIFLLGRALAGTTAGLVACASYGLMSTSPAVLGLAAHATQFVVLFAVPGTLLLWWAVQSGRRDMIFASGLLYGLAFIMKQQGMFFGAFGLLVLFWHEWGRSPRRAVKDSAQRICLFLLGAVLPLLMICIVLAVSGVFAKFWFWTFAYAWQYATNIPLAEGFGNLLNYVRDNFRFYAGFWVLAAAGLLTGLLRRIGRERVIFVLGLLLFSFLGTVPGCHFYNHYFVLTLPAFALILGISVERLQSLSGSWLRAIPPLLLAGAVLWGFWLQRQVFVQLPPQTVSQVLYGGNPFVESVVVARYIQEHSSPDTRVAVFGSEPEIYFYARRHSATGYIYTDSLMENQPYAATMQHEMMGEIESAQPEYFVVIINAYSWMFQESSDMEIWGWAQKYTTENYDCIGLVDLRSGAPALELWGEAAKNFIGQLPRFYAGRVGQYLEVYKRKS